jgi:rare lipoprotein A
MLTRFRVRRRRVRALALVPLAVLTTAITVPSSHAASAQPLAGEGARISASDHLIRVGKRVVLRGAFEGAANARVQIQRRIPGAGRWRNATRTHTGPRGRFRVRLAPRRTLRWRALLLAPATASGAGEESSLDPDAAHLRSAGATRIRVRSRTRARVIRRHVVAGERTRIAGRVLPGGRRKVTLRAAGSSVTVRTGPRGRFSARLPVGRTGVHRVRARAAGNRRALGNRARAGRVTAYRPVGASYYGPGFYGGRTACGHTLTPSTVGTAHRTLPCGTRVRIRYRGRTVTVRVIDRGPFIAGRELDLTYATKRQLGFGSTGTVLMSR